VIAIVVVVREDHGDGHPERVAVAFLEAQRCDRLRALADPQFRTALDASACRTLTDAATGRRTYANPRRDRDLIRKLGVGATEVTGDRAQVTVTVTYSTVPPRPERIVVVLTRSDDRWLVQDWGIPR
jgi:hypothetical protein